MGLSLVCGFAGAFAASRGLHLTQMTVAGAVIASLAAAVFAGAVGRTPSVAVALVPLGFVCFSAALDGSWSPILAALLAAVPFGICAICFPRPSGRGDALFSAVTGATLGLVPAVFILFVAALAAIVFGRATKATAATLQFAPYVAALTLVGVLTNLALAG
jgi:hypothetical protein